MRVLLPVLLLGALALPAPAQCDITHLEAVPPIFYQSDGELDGDVLVLAGDGKRFVVFERGANGWEQSASVLVDASYLLDSVHVALDGDRLAVGSPEDGPDPTDIQGSVRVFERASGWSVPQLVLPDQPQDWDVFGRTLDLAGDVLVVGAPQHIAFFGNGPGRAFVFEFDGNAWQQAAELHPHDQGTLLQTEYADAVATDGRTVAIGAALDSQAAPEAGAVYLHQRTASGWVEVDKLFSPAASPGVGFGRSVAVQGDTLAVGELWRVRVFAHTALGWQQEAVLEPVDPSLFDGFGDTLALDGDDLVVGTPEADVAGTDNDVGALHVYRRGPGGWAPAALILADDATPGTYLGADVALDQGVVLGVGAQSHARLIDLGLGRVPVVCGGGASSVGVPALLRAAGCDSLLADALTLGLRDAPPGAAAWLRVSTSTASAPFGNGTLCLGAPSTLLAAGVSDAQGAWSVAPDLAAPPFDAWTAGTTVYLQAGFRDTGFGAGHGTSDAIAVALQP